MTDKWDSPDGRTHSEGDGCGEAHGREGIEAVIERCEALRVVGAQDGEGTALVDAGDLRRLIACAKALRPFVQPIALGVLEGRLSTGHPEISVTLYAESPSGFGRPMTSVTPDEYRAAARAVKGGE